MQLTQTVTSGRRRASDDRVHHQPVPHRSAPTTLPSRRSLRVQPHAAAGAPRRSAVPGSATSSSAGVVAAEAVPVVVVPTEAAPAVPEQFLTRRELREREAAAQEAGPFVPRSQGRQTEPGEAPDMPAAPAGRADPVAAAADVVLPSRRSARQSSAAVRLPSRSQRRSAVRPSPVRPAAGRTPAITRLRDNAATAGIVFAAAGLLLGAVAPSTPANGTDASAAALDAAGVARASGIAPAVTAPADAPVTFGLESTGGAAEGIAPSIASARALSSSVTPAAKDRKAFSVPVDNPVVASTFGYRVNPMGGYGSELHTGLDYASACGTPVKAADAGVVIDSGWHAYGGGQRIVIDHGDGMKTTYNHMSVLGVPAGTTVQRGDLLGAVGSTGNSTGCHLHFEVLVKDEKVDPQPWL